jgi:phosphatidylserine/phosphatidylglycerophosphate/cardiolipin synthase-like enzyme
METGGHSILRTPEFIDCCIGLPLKNIDNIVEHAKRLAFIGREMRAQCEKCPPMRVLLMALMEAHSFVHFVSYGVSPMMIGVLKMIAQRVPVRGIVSNPGENIVCEVDEFQYEAPNLEIRFCASKGYRSVDIPHQKLIVIDGLLAFKGSANFTDTAWRSAAKGKEIIEVVTNIDEIVRLHNQFFSPMWGKMNEDEYKRSQQEARSQSSQRMRRLLEADRADFVSRFPSLADKYVIGLWD